MTCEQIVRALDSIGKTFSLEDQAFRGTMGHPSPLGSLLFNFWIPFFIAPEMQSQSTLRAERCSRQDVQRCVFWPQGALTSHQSCSQDQHRTRSLFGTRSHSPTRFNARSYVLPDCDFEKVAYVPFLKAAGHSASHRTTRYYEAPKYAMAWSPLRCVLQPFPILVALRPSRALGRGTIGV